MGTDAVGQRAGSNLYSISSLGADYDRSSALFFQFSEKFGSLSANLLNTLATSVCHTPLPSELRWRLVAWGALLTFKLPPAVISKLPCWTTVLISALGMAYQNELCSGDNEEYRLDISNMVLHAMK